MKANGIIVNKKDVTYMLVAGALVALFMLFLTKLYDFGYEYTKQKYEVASLKG